MTRIRKISLSDRTEIKIEITGDDLATLERTLNIIDRVLDVHVTSILPPTEKPAKKPCGCK
jgi:hypothetical protein